MTTAPYLLGQMIDRFREITPHRDHRGYVGMSGIGGCLYDLYMRARHNIPPSDRLKWYGLTGAWHEAAVKRLLGQDAEAVTTFLGYPNPEHELVADFDARYRGHYDAVMPDGTLIEAKSVNWKKFAQVKRYGAFEPHEAQCQAYMRHGGFDHAILVYICRDMPHKELFSPACPLWTVDVERNEAWMDNLDDRAQRVLAALDGDYDPPSCTCGYCGQNWAGVE